MTSRHNLLLCVAVVVLSIAATNPVLEMGLNDDWSYTYSARELAATGHLHYHGWASAMLGAQAWFAALAIRAVGFSFTIVRLTTAVFAAGCAFLLFKLGRATGLNSAFACFGTLAVVISPLVVPLSASYMTDVPSLFFLLACFYCGARALETAKTRDCILWLSAAAASGVLGGTVRQVIWGAPLSVIPVVAWLRRDDRRIAAGGGVLFAASAATVAVCLRWLWRQPLFEWDPSPQSLREVLSIFSESVRFLVLMRTGLLLVLPVTALYFFGWGRVQRWRIVIPGLLMVVVVWAIEQVTFHGRGFPYGNLVTRFGVLNEGTEAIGLKPVLLSRGLLAALSLVTLAAATACLVALLHRSNNAPSKSTTSAPRIWLLGVPFTAGYLVILLYRARFGDLFDRYLLLLLPAVNLPLLWLYQQRIRDRVPLTGWLLVGLFGAYGVASTHDYIAAARARLTAASLLTAAGVPRTRITAGIEYDGWTQIEAKGYVNNWRIKVPAGTYRFPPASRDPSGLWYQFWSLTPSVDPQYFVVYSRQPALVDTVHPPVTYAAWLPPLTRAVYIQSIPGKFAASVNGRPATRDRP